MVQLKLPRLPADGGASLPPEWGWKNDAARRSAVVLLGRREFLKAAALLFAALATPVTGVRRWRAELFGSDQVPGADFNDVALGGPLVGLRRIYQDGLKKVDEMATALSGKPYAKLPPDEQDRLLALFDAGAFQPDPRRGGMTFISLVIEHTLEGCLALPEYGGNRGRRGWKMLGLEGDSP